MNHPPRVGMIGLGLLGSALAERMLAAGWVVVGYDQSEDRRRELVRRGGREGTLRVVAAELTLVLCLPDLNVVAQVLKSIDGIQPAGALVIDATTGDPEATVAIALALQKNGVSYVDATIGGSSQQARDGVAIVMAGGEVSTIERAAPVLSSWGKQWFHVGPASSGARMKLILNLALGLQRAVLAEALNLAARVGVEPATALAIMRAGPAYATCMDTKGPKMLAADYSPQARLAQHAKDVRLIRDLAARSGASVPLTAVHEEILQRAIALGWGDADNSAVLCAYQNRDRQDGSRP